MKNNFQPTEYFSNALALFYQHALMWLRFSLDHCEVTERLNQASGWHSQLTLAIFSQT